MRKRIPFKEAMTMFNLGLDIRHPGYPDNRISDLNNETVVIHDYRYKSGAIDDITVYLSDYYRNLNWIVCYS